MAEEIISVEYPVRRERLARMVASAHGLGRVRQNRIDSVWSAIDRTRLVVDRAGFVWPHGTNTAEHTGYRAGALRHLDMDDLHPQEIRNAVHIAVRRNGFADEEDVLRSVLDELGASRMTAKNRTALEAAYREVTEQR